MSGDTGEQNSSGGDSSGWQGACNNVESSISNDSGAGGAPGSGCGDSSMGTGGAPGYDTCHPSESPNQHIDTSSSQPEQHTPSESSQPQAEGSQPDTGNPEQLSNDSGAGGAPGSGCGDSSMGTGGAPGYDTCHPSESPNQHIDTSSSQPEQHTPSESSQPQAEGSQPNTGNLEQSPTPEHSSDSQYQNPDHSVPKFSHEQQKEPSVTSNNEKYYDPSNNICHDLEGLSGLKQNFTPTNIIDLREIETQPAPTLNPSAIRELGAHKLGYENLNSNGSPTDSQQMTTDPANEFARTALQNFGYNVKDSQPVPGPHGDGFAMRTFVPSDPESGLPPMIVFRGTDDAKDLFLADTDPDGVGSKQYNANKELIQRELDKAYSHYGPVAVLGHSLGGANAQRTSIDNPNKVKEVETFQSARISHLEAAKFDANNKERAAKGLPEITSIHHRVNVDVVPTAGENMTKGVIYTYNINLTNSQKQASIASVSIGTYLGGVLGAYLGNAAVGIYQGHLSWPLTVTALQQGEGKTIPGGGQYFSPVHPTFSAPSITSTEQDKGAGINEYMRLGIGIPIHAGHKAWGKFQGFLSSSNINSNEKTLFQNTIKQRYTGP
jgi:hypothetical protein